MNLSGVGEAIEKHRGPLVESKGIKAHWTLDDSGLLGLQQVELVLERSLSADELQAEESPLSKLGSTISKLFTGKGNYTLIGQLFSLKLIPFYFFNASLILLKILLKSNNVIIITEGRWGNN